MNRFIRRLATAMQLGVAAGPATAAMMWIGFATLWWAVIVGFLALFLLRLRFPEPLREPASVAV